MRKLDGMAMNHAIGKKSLAVFIAVMQFSSVVLADAEQSKHTVTATGATSAAATIYSIKKLKYAEKIEAKNTRVLFDFAQQPAALDSTLVNRAVTQAPEGEIVTIKYFLSESESRERFVQIAEKRLAELQSEVDKLEEVSRLREEIKAVRSGKAVEPIMEVARLDTAKISLKEFLTARAEKGSKLLNLSSVPRKFSIEFSKLRGKVGVAIAASGAVAIAGIYVYSVFDVESIEVTEYVTVEESDLQKPTPYVRPAVPVQ